VPEAAGEHRAAVSVGAYLKGLREARGVSLEEVARVTRLSREYLAAIEADNFAKLPGTAYLKGALRAYAGFLGISGNEVVERFTRDQERPAEKGPSQTRAAGGGLRPAPGFRGRWLVPLVLFSLVLLFALLGGEREEQRPTPPPPPQAPAVPVPAASALPNRTSATRSAVAPAPFPTVPEPPAAAPPLPLTPSATEGGQPPRGIVLRLKVSQDGWLNIDIDGVASQQYDLKAGDVIEWKAEREFTLDLGNAGGVEAEFNGKPLQPFGEAGKAAHVVLKADESH